MAPVRGAAAAVWWWGPVAMVAAGILFGSIDPEPSMPSEVPDVSLHGSGYGLLTLVLVRALSRARWTGVSARVLMLACVLAVAYGLVIEGLQTFVPARDAEWRDVWANAAGAFAAALAVKAWDIIRRS